MTRLIRFGKQVCFDLFSIYCVYNVPIVLLFQYNIYSWGRIKRNEDTRWCRRHSTIWNYEKCDWWWRDYLISYHSTSDSTKSRWFGTAHAFHPIVSPECVCMESCTDRLHRVAVTSTQIPPTTLHTARPPMSSFPLSSSSSLLATNNPIIWAARWRTWCDGRLPDCRARAARADGWQPRVVGDADERIVSLTRYLLPTRWQLADDAWSVGRSDCRTVGRCRTRTRGLDGPLEHGRDCR